jgi:hypothetical protein
MLFWPVAATAADAQGVKKYFAHPVVEDRDGVIAPWYRGQNGQVDFRVRVAAETMKRYPWADKDVAVMAAPHFVFNSAWRIQRDGTIIIPRLGNTEADVWLNGDLGQRSMSKLQGLTAYYRYTGDPAGLCVIEMDGSGKVLVEHPKLSVTKPGGYTELSQSFTTTASTTRVRFLLDTVIGCRYDQGHVTYDDCALVRQAK